MLHASSHRNLGKSWSYNISFVAPTIVLFFISTITLCRGLYGFFLSSDAFLHTKISEVFITGTSFTDPSINTVFHDFDSLEYDHEYDVKHTNSGVDIYAEDSSEENSGNNTPSPSIKTLESSLIYLMNEYYIPLTSYK